MTISGCAKPPSETANPGSSASAGSGSSAGTGGAGYKACMVSDAGGFDDKSFNQTSHKGLTDAKAKLGVETGQVESASTADFAKNIQSMVDAKCNIVVTVGFLLSDAVMAAAKANPNVQFAIVDDNPKGASELKNLKPLTFNTAESSFLAGYVAASQSKTGKVGTFGGMKIPTVTIFMDGYAQGVKYYNEKKGKQVAVLGWDAAKQDGQFVPGDKPFDNVQGGKQTATNLMSQGADVIFPVAGPSGEGGLQAAQASGGKVSAIWVDTDGCVSAANYCSSIVTSVAKAMDTAVFEAIKAGKEGSFANTPYVGTLANKGTSISPFHNFDSKVDAATKSELEQITKDIQSGTIKIESVNQPK
ncbi:BMP family lipoprotein [Mariniluteicoccus flavus]